MKNQKEIENFSKQKRRRLKKSAVAFSTLLKKDELKFSQRWNERIEGWASEIRHRARLWREDKPETAENEVEKQIEYLGIFDVFDTAEIFIEWCGENVRAKVVAETREILLNECVKAVSYAFDAKFDRLLIQKWIYKRMNK